MGVGVPRDAGCVTGRRVGEAVARGRTLSLTAVGATVAVASDALDRPGSRASASMTPYQTTAAQMSKASTEARIDSQRPQRSKKEGGGALGGGGGGTDGPGAEPPGGADGPAPVSPGGGAEGALPVLPGGGPYTIPPELPGGGGWLGAGSRIVSSGSLSSILNPVSRDVPGRFPPDRVGLA